VERAAKLGGTRLDEEKIDCSLPLMDRIGISPLPPGKKAVEFKVCHRDPVTKSIISLGNIVDTHGQARGTLK
jgi:hypothetical protein